MNLTAVGSKTKKISMKKINLLLSVLVLGAILLSCQTSQHSSSAGWTYDGNSNQLYANTNKGFADFYDESGRKSERKILFSANLSLVVAHPDTTNFHLERIANKYKGYVNELGTYRTIIRVKSVHLKEAIDEISTLGKIQDKNMSGQDVTEKFLDYQIRLENAQNARERYLELLAKAENVEAALKVEKELERLNETIDLLKGKMNRINHLSEFSTITITLKEKKKPGVLGYVGVGIYKSVKWLFIRN